MNVLPGAHPCSIEIACHRFISAGILSKNEKIPLSAVAMASTKYGCLCSNRMSTKVYLVFFGLEDNLSCSLCSAHWLHNVEGKTIILLSET